VIINSFDPIIDKNSLILILGTIPGKKSLEKKEYYAYSGNKFWEIIYSIFGADFKQSTSYVDKKEFLKSKRIALWDVLRSCNRRGSSDSKIENPQMNDFIGLFEKHPNLKHIAFNGENALIYFVRYFPRNDPSIKLEFYPKTTTVFNREIFIHRPLPPTSGRYRVSPEKIAEKIDKWRKLKELWDAEIKSGRVSG